MNHNQAPIYDALIAYSKQINGNFHVPGHKQGQFFDPVATRDFTDILKLDMTEVADLDDLHDAEGIIAKAQQLAADAFGAEETIFLVGGTTAGILASVLHVCRPGDEILIQRSSHQSVFHGCLLAGARPVYLGTSVDADTCFEKQLTADQVFAALRKYPDIKAVFITSPSYYGILQPIAEIAAVCHQFSVPLIVDEAHGAHFVAHDRLPTTAMQCGADIAIQSTHKMLASMTMSSMLHLQGTHVHKTGLTHWLRVIESSSPSYPLMASLDLARRDLVQHGQERFARVYTNLSQLRSKLCQLEHVVEWVVDETEQDPMKMSLMAAKRQMSGFELSDYLQQQGLYPELADDYRVLLAFSFGTTAEECAKLWRALSELDDILANKPTQVIHPTKLLWQSTTNQAAYSYEQMRQATKFQVTLHNAVGEIAAEMITPYPSGVPAILPGEVIYQNWVDQLDNWIRQGGKVRGISNDSSQHVWIMRM